jgi:hypothetical protein
MYLQNGISLNCLLLGETSNENFQVTVAKSSLIGGHLKYMRKKKH